MAPPPLSLHESAKQAAKPLTFASTLPRLGDLMEGGLLGANAHPTLSRLESAKPRLTPKSGPWNMPILEPNPKVDHRIVLKEPDPTIDFKMLIKRPVAEAKTGAPAPEK
jgi:hypothetical protein